MMAERKVAVVCLAKALGTLQCRSIMLCLHDSRIAYACINDSFSVCHWFYILLLIWRHVPPYLFT